MLIVRLLKKRHISTRFVFCFGVEDMVYFLKGRSYCYN